MKPDVNALHPDVNTTEPPPAFHNYLDDFLQAVRVFGFLEKPVSKTYGVCIGQFIIILTTGIS